MSEQHQYVDGEDRALFVYPKSTTPAEPASQLTPEREPELMTPEEWYKPCGYMHATPGMERLHGDGYIFHATDSRGVQYAVIETRDGKFSLATQEQIKNDINGIAINADRDMQFAHMITDAVHRNRPVSLIGMKMAFGKTIPEGYIRDGDRYVFCGVT